VNPPKCTSSNFFNFLISTYQACTCSEACRCLPNETESIAHDSVKRLLERQPHHTEALYDKAKRMVKHDKGVLVIDDSTLDKPYSHQIEMVTRHWSGKHHRVVQGINLISTIWTDGTAIIPVDFRIYYPEKDGKNKNDHFRDVKKLSNEVAFFFHYWLFFAWKLIGCIRVSAGTSRNARFNERQLPSLSRNRRSNPIPFCWSYYRRFSTQTNSTA